MRCRSRNCPECNDQLIHQNNRRAHEAASGLLQFIHDELPPHADIIDVDVPFWIGRRKLVPPLYWYMEHKPIGGQLRPSQKAFLPEQAQVIELAIKQGIWHPDSGVFTIWSDPPHERGIVRRVRGNGTASAPVDLDGSSWRSFLIRSDDAPFIG